MGCIRKIKQQHGLDGLMRENSECGKQCRSESMRAELRLLRQPFFFLLFYFFPITLHIFRTRHLKAHSSNGKQNVTSKVKWRCFKLHRHISVQFSEFHLGEFSRVQKKAKNQRCLLLTLPLKAKLGNFRSYQNAPQNALQNVCCHATFTLSAAVVVSYCMIFPVGSDNAKEGYRLRTSIGRPAPRGIGVFSGI